MRKLSIDGREYVWRVYRRRSRGGRDGSASKMAAQIFMAADSGYPAARLRILFDNTEVYPERVGIVLADADPPRCVNLHLPRNAEAIIRHALRTVWQPASRRGVLEIPDGRRFIVNLPMA